VGKEKGAVGQLTPGGQKKKIVKISTSRKRGGNREEKELTISEAGGKKWSTLWTVWGRG